MPSLLTAVDSTFQVHLIVGSNPLAAARCAKSLEVGAKAKLIAPETAELHYALQKRIDSGEIEWLKKAFEEQDLMRLGRGEVGGVVDMVFVTHGPREPLSAKISSLCKRNRIPVNVADAPSLCTFALLATHTDGPLQIGVTTNGKGCKLAARMRREIASSLPPDMGKACERLGTMRKRIQQEDHFSNLTSGGDLEDDETLDQSSSFNKLVPENDSLTEAAVNTAKSRRLGWLSQICEYWPLSRLASITDEDIESVLKAYRTSSETVAPISISALESRTTSLKKGRIILAGSGPGHPDLLTRATYKAIMTADIILADKLVPSGVLDLIPRRTPIHIARKFPGNAEAAQEELLSRGLEGLKAGKTVLRLKQGDPFIYGRGGEEYLFFKREGYEERIMVLPGVTSALSAPLFAGIPATHRAVSDQVLICTGTGRKGAPTIPPEYIDTRTVVFLMALHRIAGLVSDLTTESPVSEGIDEKRGNMSAESDVLLSRKWPISTPCAVIERASCPEQRVIRTTLEYVVEAIEEAGSRPPGLLVLGKACEILWKGEKGRKWVVEEGWRGLNGLGVAGMDLGDVVQGG